MSILSNKTEKKALNLMARALPHLQKLTALYMTAEDAFRVREAENSIRSVIENNGYYPVRKNSRSIKLIRISKPKTTRK